MKPGKPPGIGDSDQALNAFNLFVTSLCSLFKFKKKEAKLMV